MRLILFRPPVQGGVFDFVETLQASCWLNQAPLFQVIRLELSEHLPTVPLQAGDIPVIQYSGYGYAKRGAPLWLLDRVKAWRQANIKTGIFFHEVYAFGPPWRSSFWLSPVQRHIARRLVELSDFWMTSREGSAVWLRRVAGGKPHKPHAVLPVFSSVGERPTYAPHRQPRIVIFGGAGLRKATYRAAGSALFDWARKQGLEVHDIGPEITDAGFTAELCRAGVICHGRLAAEDVSKLLTDAMFGVVIYPVEYVAKSSVFAAYCAHGVCPVLISKRYMPVDGLMASEHYMADIPTGVLKRGDIDPVATAAWKWYQTHRVQAHVNTLKKLLVEVGITC